MRLEGKKILVTGGAGFIGSHLVDALIKNNCYVRVVDNLSSGKPENLNQHKNNKNFEFILGDILKPSDLAIAMKDIDIVFHLACLGVRHSLKYPLENHQVNSAGTLLALEAARRAKIEKFIYCSSSEVYGTAGFVPMDESHPVHPNTVYGASKLAGEAYARAYCRTYGLEAVIVRPFNTYGPRSHHEQEAGEMIPKAIVRAMSNEPVVIFGDGSQTRDYTYVEDIARGLLKAAEYDGLIGLTFNMGSGFEISIKKLAEMILEFMKINTLKIEYRKNRPGDVLRLYSDSIFFHKKTGWHPEISLEEGLLKTIHWFKSRPESPSALLSQEKAVNWE